MAEKRMGILALFVTANLLNYADRYVLASVLEAIGHELSLTDVQLGNLAFAFLAGYLLAAGPFSYLADRFSRSKLVASGILLWSVATAAAALATDYSTLFVTRALVGVGEAAYATIGPAILADLFPEKVRTRIFTWFYLAIPVGSALGFAMGGLVEGTAGWRASFLLAGAPGLALALLFWKMKDPEIGALDHKGRGDAALPFFRKFRSLASYPTFIACTVSYIGYSFAMGALTHWAPTFFQRELGQSASTAGLALGGIAVAAGIVGTLAGGYLSDALQDRYPNIGLWLSAATLLASAPVMYWGLIETHAGQAYALWALGMVLLFINTSPINALTVSCLPPRLRAVGMASNLLFVHLFGDAISPSLVGLRSMRAGASGLESGLMICIPAIILAASALIPAITRAAGPVREKPEGGVALPRAVREGR